MADIEADYSTEDAAADIERIMSGKPSEPAAEVEAPAAPAEETKSEPETAEAAPAEESTSEEAQAPAGETKDVASVQPQETKPASQQAAPTEDVEAKQAREQLQSAVTYAKALLPKIHEKLMGEFADIKSLADLNQVGRTDPDRYNRYILARSEMQDVVTEYQRLEKSSADAAAAAGPKIDWAAEKKKLDEAIPDLANPEKGPALERKLNEYAKEKGISPVGKTAAEIQTLYESMQLRDLKAKEATTKAAEAAALAEANKKAAQAPQVQKPGTPRNTTSAKEEQVKDKYSQFAKTGRIDDLASFLQSSGI